MKPKRPVWIHFDRDNSNSKNVKATCRGCKRCFQAIPKRMEKHVEICPDLNRDPDNWETEARDDGASTSASTSAPKKAKTTFMDSVVIKTSAEDIEKLNLQMTRFVIATNSPFSLVDNPHFKEFYRMLRPRITLAERHRVGGELTDSVHQEEVTKSRHSFSGKYSNDILLFVRYIPANIPSS